MPNTTLAGSRNAVRVKGITYGSDGTRPKDRSYKLGGVRGSRIPPTAPPVPLPVVDIATTTPMDCNTVLSLTGSLAALSPSLSLRWTDMWLLGSQPLSGDKGVSYLPAKRGLDERSFGLKIVLTNHIQVSIWGRNHRVDLGEKKALIEWEVSRGSIAGGGPVTPLQEGPADLVPRVPSDYVVDVYLTE